jgi:hypothetical protein
MKKTRSDSLYAALSPKQREEVYDACSNAWHLTKIVALCAGWGVRTSPAALSRFYANRLLDYQEEQLQLAKSIAGNMPDAEEIQKGINSITRQKLFESVLKLKPDPKVLLALRKIELAEEANALSRERLLSKLDAGLEALHREIKGNPKALAIFEELKGALKK